MARLKINALCVFGWILMLLALGALVVLGPYIVSTIQFCQETENITPEAARVQIAIGIGLIAMIGAGLWAGYRCFKKAYGLCMQVHTETLLNQQ